ncbi:maltose acetyltransferase-domain-containing protein [Xylaria digitata]|nr:maltose acetyltransferase-domain-containing protein [Xylaria digitata]
MRTCSSHFEKNLNRSCNFEFLSCRKVSQAKYPAMASAQKDHTVIEAAKSLAHVPWSDSYEKMISGMLYDAQTPELVSARFKARRFMQKYNTHFPDDATPESLVRDREEMLKGTLGALGTGRSLESLLPLLSSSWIIDYLIRGFLLLIALTSSQSLPQFSLLMTMIDPSHLSRRIHRTPD